MAGLSVSVVSLLVFVAISAPIVAARQMTLTRRAIDLGEKEAEAQRKAASARQQESEKARQQVQEEAEGRRRLLYKSDTNLAMRAWDDANVQRVIELLLRHISEPNETDLRGFEWYYLFNLCTHSLETPASDHTSPFCPRRFRQRTTSSHMPTGMGVYCFLKTNASRPTLTTEPDLPECLAFSPDGRSPRDVMTTWCLCRTLLLKKNWQVGKVTRHAFVPSPFLPMERRSPREVLTRQSSCGM